MAMEEDPTDLFQECLFGSDYFSSRDVAARPRISTRTIISSAACVSAIAAVVASCKEDTPKETGFTDKLEQKSDSDFFRYLRVTRSSFRTVLDLVTEAYGPSPSGKDLYLGPKKALYVTLWYLGNSVTYREISELFGVAECTVFDCVQKTIDVLCAAEPRFIKWPNEEEAVEVEKEFRQLAGFPGVIGALDGCHIEIKAPAGSQADYLNRTSRLSINLIAVCRPNKRFTFIQAGFPGSMHNSRVYKSSILYKKILSNPLSLFPSNNFHLLGSAEFPLYDHLQVPFRDTEKLTDSEISYNSKHFRTRGVIDDAFSLLKGRFSRLKYIDADIERIPKIIKACCVLHNITLQNQSDLSMLENEGPHTLPKLKTVIEEENSRQCEGAEKRRAISQQL